MQSIFRSVAQYSPLYQELLQSLLLFRLFVRNSCKDLYNPLL